MHFVDFCSSCKVYQLGEPKFEHVQKESFISFLLLLFFLPHFFLLLGIYLEGFILVGKFFGKSFLIAGLDGSKCGSRWVVEQDIHVNFRVNFTWFSLCLFVCPLTESCSFWRGLKDLFTLHKLADKVGLDR